MLARGLACDPSEEGQKDEERVRGGCRAKAAATIFTLARVYVQRGGSMEKKKEGEKERPRWKKKGETKSSGFTNPLTLFHSRFREALQIPR